MLKISSSLNDPSIHDVGLKCYELLHVTVLAFTKCVKFMLHADDSVVTSFKNTYLPEWPHLFHNVTSTKLYDIDSSLLVNIKHSELG